MSVSTSPPRLPHLARLAKHRPPVIQSQTATHNVALLLYALTARGRVANRARRCYRLSDDRGRVLIARPDRAEVAIA